jgi:hydroxyacylglutathione hydrolase
VRRLQEELDLPCYGPADPRIPGHSQSVRPGQRLRPENYDGEFEVIDSPGHTLTHLSFRIEDELYCGDTLFSLGCGRLFEGTPEQMHASLTRLAALPSDTRVFCAHEYTLANARFARTVEPSNRELEEFERRVSARRAEGLPSLPSTLAEEHACNPFLRCAEPRVQAAAEQRAGRRLGSEVEVFAVLRAWKDEFRA